MIPFPFFSQRDLQTFSPQLTQPGSMTASPTGMVRFLGILRPGVFRSLNSFRTALMCYARRRGLPPLYYKHPCLLLQRAIRYLPEAPRFSFMKCYFPSIGSLLRFLCRLPSFLLELSDLQSSAPICLHFFCVSMGLFIELPRVGFIIFL